ncbi:von Hippel-Lindau disease tumor suppressor-like [Haliotis cracherodii]|uniref:von Hippel-Lindau disease tumor suppressor-like n=1 Tax=Haliotis cracherodii TaxID=6455 RepID=UPI0039ED3FF0
MLTKSTWPPNLELTDEILIRFVVCPQLFCITMTGNEGNAAGNGRPKSGKSTAHSFVRFVNNTRRRVDIIWLNYEGARIKYRTLLPQQFVDVNTFVGHPWVFRDSESGDRLVVQLKEIYEPIGWTQHDGWPPCRKVVHISIPVYSLKERCMQVVRKFVPRDQICQLEVPTTLKVALKDTVVIG